MGNVLPAGQGQAPARQASLKARAPAFHRLHDDQQDVRLGDEGGDARARPDRRRDQRDHGRGRHGEHDQRALPDAQGARRLPDGPPDRLRPHVPRRPRGRLRQGPADGHLRGRLRGHVLVHARGAGRLRAGLPRPRARRQQRRHVRLGDRAGHGVRPQGRGRLRPRRAAGQGEPRQDPDAQARVQEGRHRHRCQLQLDLRRRRGAGADAPLDGREARPEAARGDRRPRDARGRARPLPDRPDRRDPRALREDRLERRRTSTCSRSTRRSRS